MHTKIGGSKSCATVPLIQLCSGIEGQNSAEIKAEESNDNSGIFIDSVHTLSDLLLLLLLFAITVEAAESR